MADLGAAKAGSHRLICGDSKCADVVGQLLSDVRPLLMVTDPPYVVEYHPFLRNQTGADKTKGSGRMLDDDCADCSVEWALLLGDVAYFWHGALEFSTEAESLATVGFAVRSPNGRCEVDQRVDLKKVKTV